MRAPTTGLGPHSLRRVGPRDDALPAARVLGGPDAIDVLRAPIEAAGGRLVSAVIRHVHYRPGSDVVVQYATDVSSNGGPVESDTHMASSVVGDCHRGTVPVVADVNGEQVRVGVWRWPFDPALPGLSRAATPRSAAALLGITDLDGVVLRLVSFRPTVRAVFELRTPRRTFFIKVIPPAQADALVARHEAAIAAGVPAARVVVAFADLGIVVLDALEGSTMREIVKTGRGALPDANEFDRLDSLLAAVELPTPQRVPDRRQHARLHAQMLSTVMPESSGRLDAIDAALAEAIAPEPTSIVHGDLHEGQLVVGNGVITGVLDLDDLGRGSSLDERANVIGFLRYRAATRPAMSDRVTAIADRYRTDSARTFDPHTLDVATGAVLVGLATGPYRTQHADWRSTTSAVLDVADALLGTRDRANALGRM